MAEVERLAFTYKEIAAALVREQDLREGLWGIYIEFGLAAANIPGPEEGSLVPAAIIPIVKIGLQRFDEASNLAVDASEVNPGSKARSAQPRRKIESK